MSEHVFPASYDELAVLAHHGASDDELARRYAEREAMSELDRFRADVAARAHVGPTLDEHRERWAAEHPAVPAAVREAGPHVVVPAGTAGGADAAPLSPAGSPTTPTGGSDGPTAAAGDVPDGTMSAVLAWVGVDPARAAAAINAERERPDPRVSLLDKLAKLAAAADGQ